MGVVMNEPSMEDILSSIKRIIADGSDRAPPSRSLRRRAPDRDEDDLPASGDEGIDMGQDMDVEQGARTTEARATEEGDPAILELTDMVEEPTEMNEVAATPTRKAAPKTAAPQQAPALAEPVPASSPEQDDVILSDFSAQAARQSLNQLSSLLVRPQEGEANTLEGLVREMLRPMLKDWLEENLPDLVQSMVKKEIDRIVGRLG